MWFLQYLTLCQKKNVLINVKLVLTSNVNSFIRLNKWTKLSFLLWKELFFLFFFFERTNKRSEANTMWNEENNSINRLKSSLFQDLRWCVRRTFLGPKHQQSSVLPKSSNEPLAISALILLVHVFWLGFRCDAKPQKLNQPPRGIHVCGNRSRGWERKEFFVRFCYKKILLLKNNQKNNNLKTKSNICR